MTTLETYPLIKKPIRKFSANIFWVVAAILMVPIFMPKVVFALGWDSLAVGLGQIIYYIGIAFPALVLELELWILPMIAQYNEFTRESGVVTGWTALRDLANMFFILILLIISFATILRIDRFGYRQLLSRLIIMAVLINFSMTITGLLIDLSQVIMLTFIDAVKDVTAGNILVALGLAEVNQFGEATTIVSGVNYLKAMFLGAIMMIIAVVVVAAFVLVLAARIVKLWILLVISPMVFLAYSFPLTEKYYNQWVDELTKNLVSGPALAFFLWLSFTIVGRGDISNSFMANSPTGDVGSEISSAASTPNMINFVIGISMLIGALGYAAQQNSAAAVLSSKFKSLSKKAGGAAARRVWQGGRSAGGYGGVKGIAGSAAGGVASGLRRIGLAAQGKDRQGEDKTGRGAKVTRVLAGAAGRRLEKIGMRGQAANAARDTARDKGLQDVMKNMSPAEQARYLELSGGSADKNRFSGRFGGGDSAKRLSIQMKFDSGHYDTKAGEGDIQKDFDFLKQRGGVESHQLINKMQSKYAILDDSSTADINKDIAAGKVETQDFSGAIDATGTLNPNARRKMEALVDGMDSKDLQALFDKMNKRQQEAFKDVLANLESSRALDEGFTKDSKGNITGVDKDHAATKARMFMMNNDEKNSEVLFKRIAAQIAAAPKGSVVAQRHEAMRDSLAQSRSGAKFDIKTMLKAEAGSEYFKAMAPKLNASQISALASEGTADQRKQMVQSHVAGGGENISTLVNTPSLSSYIDNTTIRQNFQAQIKASSTPDETAKQLAKNNLQFAQEVYTNPTDLAKFINDNLDVDQASKIDPKELVAIWSDLSVAMQAALEKKGISP